MRTPHQSVDRLGSRPVESAVTPAAPATLPLSGAVDDGDRLVDVVDLFHDEMKSRGCEQTWYC